MRRTSFLTEGRIELRGREFPSRRSTWSCLTTRVLLCLIMIAVIIASSIEQSHRDIHVYIRIFFFRVAPVPPIISPDTPIGEVAQPIEGRSTRSLSMPLDRGRATNASL